MEKLGTTIKILRFCIQDLIRDGLKLEQQREELVKRNEQLELENKKLKFYLKQFENNY